MNAKQITIAGTVVLAIIKLALIWAAYSTFWAPELTPVLGMQFQAAMMILSFVVINDMLRPLNNKAAEFFIDIQEQEKKGEKIIDLGNTDKGESTQ